MRLLQRSETGKFSLAKDLVGDDPIPSYAILSHRWGPDNEEVTFEDMTKGTGEKKLGYKKIRFCGEQARQHGLDYFWVDTCCIDKENKAELAQAINSMFRWYRNATRCYVYLSDVSSPLVGSNDECNPRPWESDFRKSKWFTWDWTLQAINSIFYWYRNATRRYVYLSDVSSPAVNNDDDCNPRPWESDFRKSRWFTRGWTLQELLAPASVEFFSQEGKRLGDKTSLMQQIHEITNISLPALQGNSLSQFSVDERLKWIEHRQTKLEEDKAYSLLGIFDVYIPPIYGEGTGSAFKRLLDEIKKLEKCIHDLRLSDPRDDKERIEGTKGGLLEDSYRWILENSDFQQWRRAQQSPLLWIKGDPGKGKTMLLCGIINELKKSMVKTALLSYFFCQATDSRINNATAVLRGLIYLLIDQQPSLVSHVRKKYDQAGKTLFEDANAWVALSGIFTNILQDPSLNTIYLIIDALDECIVDLPKLLDFVVWKSAGSPRVKWIVSSRNWPNIEEQLERAGHKVGLCLELNAESVSTAVSKFIQHKVLELAKQKKYNDQTRAAVLHHLSSNADDTFLWVALVCQHLEKIQCWETAAKLNKFPPGLDSLYWQMLEQIRASDNADLCKRMLASIAIVYRPITLNELTSLIEMLEDMADDPESVREIISLCGSFLTIREGTIYFVHQSAKDYLFKEAIDEIFPSGKEEAHYVIFSRSLEVMSKTLRRNIYSLGAVGYPAEQVEPPEPDPLAALRYSCIYWVDHLGNWNSNSCANYKVDLEDGGAVDEFVRTKYLHWLEALSLCGSMSGGVVSMAKLEALLQVILGPAMLSIYGGIC
jgi:NACHT domain/Heterokaryon incompatibility protein (HET)